MGVEHHETTGDASGLDTRSLAALLLLGLAVVLFLPLLAPHLPHLGSQGEARWALTGTGMLFLLGALIFSAGGRRRLSTAWMAWTWGYSAGLVVVKFVLSPSAYSRSDRSLTAFVVTGLVVSVLYLGALVAIAVAVGRRGITWGPASEFMLGIVLAGVSVIARISAAAVLGTTGMYFHDLSRGTGLILPGVVLLASIAVMQSYKLAGSNLRQAFWLSVSIVLMVHALWVVYMYRLFR